MARKSNPDQPKPWAALGIAKSTYYYRQSKGIPLEGGEKSKTKAVKSKAEVQSKPRSKPKVQKSKAQSKCKSEVSKPEVEKFKAEAASPVEKRSNEATRFKPGNPGKPKGTRNKLTADFVNVMCADFELHGISVIEAVRTSKPEAYLAAMVRLVPQQVEVGEAGAFTEMDDAALDAFIASTARELRQYHGVQGVMH